MIRSKLFQHTAAALFHNILRFVQATNRLDAESFRQFEKIAKEQPAIFVVWHGQHFLLPYVYGPKNGNGFVTLVSKSADAEVNALILKKAGYEVVRGSGGRVREQTSKKGGVSAILALRKALQTGKNVGIIADISKGTPRKSGKGIVSLAKHSGRPIVPLAIATSKYKIIERSWDKTTINLPFGKSCLRIGNPIYVGSESSNEELDNMRLKVDDALNGLTNDVYDIVGKGS